MTNPIELLQSFVESIPTLMAIVLIALSPVAGAELIRRVILACFPVRGSRRGR